MIVQITRTKNELFLIKELLPIWQRYADGFVFYDDHSTDGTFEYLTSDAIKAKYNILEVLREETEDDYSKKLKIETNSRQPLYDAALKYSNKIICCDSDEYIDGTFTKEELDHLLSTNVNTVFSLRWTQYTDTNTIRVDGPWGNNFKVRIGSYSSRGDFGVAQMHSLHLPPASKTLVINPDHLFIAHLQWIDKRWVGVKQYFWKVNDYVNQTVHKAIVMGSAAYDVSVNNFQWSYQPFLIPMKVSNKIFANEDIKTNYKLQFIKKYTNELNIPNLGDWGMGIYDYCVKLS